VRTLSVQRAGWDIRPARCVVLRGVLRFSRGAAKFRGLDNESFAISALLIARVRKVTNHVLFLKRFSY
jgi:hypothetical protein